MKKSELAEYIQKLRLEDFVYKSWAKGRIKSALIHWIDKQIHDVERDLAAHDKLSKSYFWSPPTNANQRRKAERDNYRRSTYFYDRATYAYHSDVECSCKNFYYTGKFFVDGEKKDRRAFAKLLESLRTDRQTIENA